jgi:hypothetical protein
MHILMCLISAALRRNIHAHAHARTQGEDCDISCIGGGTFDEGNESTPQKSASGKASRGESTRVQRTSSRGGGGAGAEVRSGVVQALLLEEGDEDDDSDDDHEEYATSRGGKTRVHDLATGALMESNPTADMVDCDATWGNFASSGAGAAGARTGDTKAVVKGEDHRDCKRDASEVNACA